MQSNPKKTYSKNGLHRFALAFHGLFLFFKKESHALIHSIAAILAISASLYYQIDRSEWMIILLSILFVFVTEIVNTAVEHLCNLITTEWNPKVKAIKDMSAGAVLVAAIGSVIVGVMVFTPYLF